jgi:hypothetical protein
LKTKEALMMPLGRHTVRWLDTPHMPHGWDCGLMMELATQTFLCGDLFVRLCAGTDEPADGGGGHSLPAALCQAMPSLV